MQLYATGVQQPALCMPAARAGAHDTLRSCRSCCSAPYWFHLARYRTRMQAVALLMAASYTTGAAARLGWVILLGRQCVLFVPPICSMQQSLATRLMAGRPMPLSLHPNVPLTPHWCCIGASYSDLQWRCPTAAAGSC